MKKFIVIMCVEAQVSGCMKVVVPTEMVGLVLGFKPRGGLTFHVEINDEFPEIVFSGAEILLPSSVDVEITDLITESDESCTSSDGG